MDTEPLSVEAFAEAEEALLPAVERAVGDFLAAARAAVLEGRTHAVTAAGRPDLNGFPDESTWRQILRARVAPVVERLWSSSYGRLATVGDAARSAAAEFTGRLADRARGFPARVWARVRSVVTRDTDQPEAEVRATVAEVLHGRHWAGQARVITRTEAAATLNAGTMAAAFHQQDRDGGRWLKKWVARDDNRTRPTHHHADGQTRPLAEPFTVGGAALQYPGDPSGPPGEVVNCRCVVRAVPAATDSLAALPSQKGPPMAAGQASMSMTPQRLTVRFADALTAAGAEQAPVEVAQDGAWSGPIGMVGEWSADDRMLAPPQDGKVRTRPLPLSVLVQRRLSSGHEGAELGVMRLDEVWADGRYVMGRGQIDMEDPEGVTLARKIRGQFIRFVSMDVDDATERRVAVGEDGQPLESTDPTMINEMSGARVGRVYDTWRVMGATMLAHPAFPDAAVGMTDQTETPEPADPVQSPAVGLVADGGPALLPDKEAEQGEPTGQDMGGGCVVPDEASQTGWSPGPCDAPGAVPANEDGSAPAESAADDGGPEQEATATQPPAGAPAVRAEDPRQPGEPADDVGNGCVKPDPENPGQFVPADCDDPEAVPADTSGAEPIQHSCQCSCSHREVSFMSLAASAFAHPDFCPPTDFFRDPQLTEPTLTHITPEGRVVGHLALWGVPHVAYQGRRIYAPHSPTSYERFHARPIRTSEGLVEVGALSMGTDHAKPWRNGRETVSHYDNTGSIVAAVRCGEDAHGIWMSGALLPDVPDDQRLRLSLADFSGDWRDEGSGLDLKAALAVPTGHEGFHVPKNRPGNSDDYALVASGALTAEHIAAAAQSGVSDAGLEARVSQMVASALEREKQNQANRERALAAADRVARLRVGLAAERISRFVAAYGAEGGGAFAELAKNNNLETYWKRGKGAAKIRWGTPGDWTRCHRHLKSKVGDQRARRICAQWHHDTTGLWPGDKNNPG